ncbi:FtsX-like permease family protein [Spirosoma sp. HMF4905]|uniref:FtsX-like permease family protein n=1 Tax=Spirosoma arboris TaxID=2682092 RepID=A0A7K1SGX8_9BACT|nr:ABC transporter permease [Spirosoma arboris]MVM33070.1 FtsX-like permease family protein [Spirosoma arboris]
MLQNYLKIAFRNLLRRRFYALVTLLGLTVGITFLLLISNYIQGELAVNKTLRNSGQQYLVRSHWKEATMGMDITTLSPIGPTLKQLYPNLVANYYRFYGITAIISKDEKHFRESIQVGDSTLIPMFGFPMAYGDPKTSLLEPNSIVITAAVAQKFFGKTDVLRQQLTVQTPAGGKQLFTVTGVLQDLPKNSVTDLVPTPNRVFMSMRDINYFAPSTGINTWQNQYIPNYLELQPGVTADQLTQPIAKVLATYAPPGFKENLEVSLSPLDTFYLKGNNGLIEKMVLTLTLIGVFILLMAVVNFINITIGISATRLREIGVRKALGGLKKQLIGQFLAEALLLTAVATILALGCHELFRSTFADLLERPIASLITWSPLAFAALIAGALLVALLAGGYPAFVLSSMPSIESLKGKLTASVQKGIGLRRALIVFQFTVAIFVFVGAMVISRQVAYFFSKDLGYQKEQIMTVASVPREWSKDGVQRMEGVRNQLARIPGVSNVSFSFIIPDGKSSGSGQVFHHGRDSTDAATMEVLTTDEHFAQTYGLQLREGQFFHANGGAYDSTRVVLNESAAKALGWRDPAKAIGQLVRFPGGNVPLRVDGVLKDFHFGSLHQTINPLIFIHVRANLVYRYFSFKLAPGSADHLQKTIAAINKEWARLFPDAPFEYSFMDDTLQKLYQTEKQLQKASRLATTLALIIVLLGVLGLVSLNVTRRTKEIGIRKVLGSSTIGIVNLFMKEFVLILIIANVIAWPLAYYLLSDWLTHFAYRTDLSWTPFALVALILALLTGLVVSVQAIRAAGVNPVKSLRSE